MTYKLVSLESILKTGATVYMDGKWIDSIYYPIDTEVHELVIGDGQVLVYDSVTSKAGGSSMGVWPVRYRNITERVDRKCKELIHDFWKDEISYRPNYFYAHIAGIKELYEYALSLGCKITLNRLEGVVTIARA